MRPFSALAVVSLCASVAAAGSPFFRARPCARESIELPAIAWTAGDVARSIQTSHSNLRTLINVDGKLVQEFDSIEDKRAEKTIRILSVDERGALKIRIEYGALSVVQRRPSVETRETQASPDDEFDTRNPLQHRTFHLMRQGRSFTVSDVNEKRVEPGLARIVLEEEGLTGGEFLRAGDLVARELAGRTLALGVDVTLSPDAVRAVVDDATTTTPLQLVLTPREVRVEDGLNLAVFTARLSSLNPNAEAVPGRTVDLRGEFAYDEDSGRCVSLELSGLVSLASVLKDDSRAVEITGLGPWMIRESVRYEATR